MRLHICSTGGQVWFAVVSCDEAKNSGRVMGQKSEQQSCRESHGEQMAARENAAAINLLFIYESQTDT